MAVAHAGGLRVPWPTEVIQIGDRWGLAMPLLAGVDGMTRLLSDLERFEDDARELAGLHRGVWACDGAGLPDRREVLSRRIGEVEALRAGERKTLLAILARLPEGDLLVHGDFHPGNLVWDGPTPWIVDWVDASRGVAAADVARSIVLFGIGAEDAGPGTPRARYREVYAGCFADLRDLEDWVMVSAAARLAEEAAASQPGLLGWVRGRLNVGGR